MKPSNDTSGSGKKSGKLSVKKNSLNSIKSRSKKPTQVPKLKPANSKSTLSVKCEPSNILQNSAKDENQVKTYAGISPKSIKCMWEQYDKTATDISTEALTKVAEDVSYKLWEVANVIKTFSRHSGGKVTTDLVNEIFKEANIPPVLGTNDSHWEKINQDGTIFFHSNEIINLRDEYLKAGYEDRFGSLAITTSWLTEKKVADNLVKMYRKICYAIFYGDDDTFNLAIETVITNMQIGTLIKFFINKCVKMLAFDYTPSTLDRVLQFLNAISLNSCARDSDINNDFLHLSRLLMCLVLGPRVPSITKVLDRILNETNDIFVGIVENVEDIDIKPPFNIVENSDTPNILNAINEGNPNNIFSIGINSTDNNGQNSVSNDIPILKQEPNQYDGVDINKIKNELFIMMESEGIQIKKEIIENDSNELNKTEVIDAFDGIQLYNPKTEYEGNTNCEENIVENLEQYVKNEIDENNEDDSTISDDIPELDNQKENFEHSELTTNMCSDDMLDFVCRTIGVLSNIWGIVEDECIYLFIKKLGSYFEVNLLLDQKDSEWLIRLVRIAWTLGDYAVREFSQYLSKLNAYEFPDKALCHFNVLGMYIKGKSDIFFYEWLYDLCGDGLQPFMVYYTGKIEKLQKQYDKRYSKKYYHILTKIQLKTQEKLKIKDSKHDFKDWFPNHNPLKNKKKENLFGFSFPGSRQVDVQTLQSKTFDLAKYQKFVQNKELLATFNSKIVVAKRKLLKPLIKEKKVNKFIDIKTIQI